MQLVRVRIAAVTNLRMSISALYHMVQCSCFWAVGDFPPHSDSGTRAPFLCGSAVLWYLSDPRLLSQGSRTRREKKKPTPWKKILIWKSQVSWAYIPLVKNLKRGHIMQKGSFQFSPKPTSHSDNPFLQRFSGESSSEMYTGTCYVRCHNVPWPQIRERLYSDT